MSGQAKRSRWRYLTRRREALARLLARDPRMPRISAGGDIGHGFAASILDGSAHFGVHAARELAHSLIALEDEQAEFEDWCRFEHGLGPENREPGAFVLDMWFYFTPVCVERAREGGWLVSDSPVTIGGRAWHPAVTPAGRGGWPGKLAREWPGDSRAPMGRTLAKLGRDLLEALEGQPSECQADECSEGLLPYDGEGEFCGFGPCPDCHGTGHNLRGVLPAVEVSVQLVRRLHEDEGGLYSDSTARWIAEMGEHPSRALATHGTTAAEQAEALELLGPDGVDARTRVVPRGEHRRDVGVGPRAVDIVTLDQSIIARGWEPWTSPRFWTYDGKRTRRELLPRWRRGELRHAAQRRERAWTSITEGHELDRAIDAQATPRS
jgi:hypothetical protein